MYLMPLNLYLKMVEMVKVFCVFYKQNKTKLRRLPLPEATIKRCPCLGGQRVVCKEASGSLCSAAGARMPGIFLTPGKAEISVISGASSPHLV